MFSRKRPDDILNPKFMIYAHDTFGMGHIQRALKVSRSILKYNPNSSILIVTGTSSTNIDVPNGVDIVKIPSVVSIIETGELSSKSKLSFDRSIELRKDIILATVKTYDPDCFLSDFSPLGFMDELLPSVRYLKRRKCKMLLMTRDIIDNKDITRKRWIMKGGAEAAKKYYDNILVFGDKNIFDFKENYDFDDELCDMIHYLGYLIDKDQMSTSYKKENEILLSVGGGRDGFEFVEKILTNIDRDVLVVAGPFFPEEKYKYLCSEYKRHKIVKDVKSLRQYMQRSKISISMCGYNTFSEIIETRLPSLVIPRENEQEQLIRAELFKNRGILDYIRKDNINKRFLEQKLYVLKNKSFPDVKFDIDGMDNLASFLAGIL